MKPAAVCKLVFVLTLFGVAGGGLFYQVERAPESSPVSRGRQVAELAGCFACHGQGENDPRTNYRAGSDGGWRAGPIDLIWEEGLLSAREVTEWVTHGVPERQRERHRRLLLQMPAYGDDGHLSPAEIDDVVAWALAEGLRRSQPAAGFAPLDSVAAVSTLDEDELLRRGDAVARTAGCYQCHGELGQGHVPNPASFKGYIPGFQGADFRQLTAGGDRAEIRHWIEHGRGHAIEQGLLGRFARRYFDRQAIPMPAYGAVLDEVQTALLVDYLLLLNGKGPLDAPAVEALATVLLSDPAD